MHKDAACKASNGDAELSNSILSATIYDMLSMSIRGAKELSSSMRQFSYFLQKDAHCFTDEKIETIAQAGGDDDGNLIITFMMPHER